VVEKKVVDDREGKFQQFMNDIKGPEGMFEGFIDNLKTCTGASGVYVGRLEVFTALHIPPIHHINVMQYHL
jgi:hypothetical protein